MREDVHVVHPSLGEDPLDLVVCLGHVALDTGSPIGRELPEAREEVVGACGHESGREDWFDEPLMSRQAGRDVHATLAEGLGGFERCFGGSFDIRGTRGNIHRELPDECTDACFLHDTGKNQARYA